MIRTRLCVVSLMVLVSLLVAVPVPATSPPVVGDVGGMAYPFDPAEVAARSSATIYPAGPRISVADSGDFERTPAAALCASNQYLVVYELQEESDPTLWYIYGQRLTASGAFLGGPFLIDTPDSQGDPHTALHPDVACEFSQNRFVVVWEYDYNGDGTDMDVRAQVVNGTHQTSGSQLVGTVVSVAASLDDEILPAIACNSDDSACLVAYEHVSEPTTRYVRGRRLAISAGGGSQDGDEFDISDSAEISLSPDLAWGPLDSNYLVAWSQWKAAAPAHYRIAVTHVYDTEQGAGEDERQHEPMWLVDLDEWEDHQGDPAVAYNPHCGDQGRYLVVFHLLTSDEDIGARRIWGTGMAAAGAPFLVASTGSPEAYPRVAADGHLDQFMVTYTTRVYESSTWYYALHGRLIKGTHDSGGSGQWLGPAFQVYQSPHSESDSNLGQGDVVGSPHNAGYAAVWHDGHLDGEDNVYAQLFKPDLVYLPCVVRNH